MNESIIKGTTEERTGEALVVTATPAYKTTEGQLTIVFTLVSLILAWFGVTASAEQMQSYLDVIVRIAEIAVPIIAALVGVNNLVNSRGKIESNTIVADAQMKAASISAGTADINLGGLVTGKIWKDPKTYIGIASIVADILSKKKQPDVVPAPKESRPSVSDIDAEIERLKQLREQL